MGFLHIRENRGDATSGTTVSVTFSVTPSPGNLICVAITGAFALTLGTVKDGNNNFYIISPNSPSSLNDATVGSEWLAYLLSAPANVHATVTATFSSGTITVATIYVHEFSYTGGPAVFDSDIVGSGTSGNAINTPSITPSGAGELLFAGAAPFSTVDPSIDESPWTASTLGVDPVTGAGAQYILSSSSGATAVNMTQSVPGGKWDSMAMAIRLTAGLFSVAGDDSQQISVIQQADNVVSIW